MHIRLLKPDGSLHKTWEWEVVAKSDDRRAVSSPYKARAQHHTKHLSYNMQHSNFGIFSTKDYFNVFLDFHPDGTLKWMYINVAYLAQWNDHEVSAEDLYLDVALKPNNKPELLDEDEFLEAKERGLIDEATAAKALEAAHDLMQKADSGQFPFPTLNRAESLREIRHYLKHK